MCIVALCESSSSFDYLLTNRRLSNGGRIVFETALPFQMSPQCSQQVPTNCSKWLDALQDLRNG